MPHLMPADNLAVLVRTPTQARGSTVALQYYDKQAKEILFSVTLQKKAQPRL